MPFPVTLVALNHVQYAPPPGCSNQSMIRCNPRRQDNTRPNNSNRAVTTTLPNSVNLPDRSLREDINRRRSRLAVTFKPLGEAHEVSLHTVNSHDTKEYGNERQILLTPGHYEITVRCIFIVDNRQIFSDGQLPVDVVADHRNMVDAGLSPQSPGICAARLVDMTTG